MMTQHKEANGLTIAVVDDDTVFLDLMHDLLTDEGYQITIHQSSSTIYHDLRNQQPNLIIQDICIGNEDNGWALLKLLKFDPTTTHIPIIVCSTDRNILEAKADYLQEHGIRPLEKPFHLADLLAAIKAVLGK
jgi:DNA-binding response OmpR family regulator